MRGGGLSHRLCSLQTLPSPLPSLCSKQLVACQKNALDGASERAGRACACVRARPCVLQPTSLKTASPELQRRGSLGFRGPVPAESRRPSLSGSQACSGARGSRGGCRRWRRREEVGHLASTRLDRAATCSPASPALRWVLYRTAVGLRWGGWKGSELPGLGSGVPKV